MVHINHDKILEAISNYKQALPSTLDEKYIRILNDAPWADDGTGRGAQTHYNGKSYHILFDKPILVPFNKLGEYTICIKCHLKKDAKYGEDMFEFRVALYDL